jgi:hypothetical protein
MKRHIRAMTRRPAHRSCTNRPDTARGQGLVEFALVSPLILVLLLALFDVGRVVFVYTTLTNASRAGARAAIVNQSNSVVCVGPDQPFKCVAAQKAVGVGIRPQDVPDVVVTGSFCAEMGTCDVTVTLSTSIDLVTGPLLSLAVGKSSFDLTTSTTMPIERVYANP